MQPVYTSKQGYICSAGQYMTVLQGTRAEGRDRNTMVASLAEKHEQACTLPAGLPRLCDGDSGYVPQGEILADVPSSRGVLCFAKPHAHGDLGRQMRGAKMSVRVEGDDLSKTRRVGDGSITGAPTLTFPPGETTVTYSLLRPSSVL